MLNHTQEFLTRLTVADREHQKERGGIFLLRSGYYPCAFILFAFVVDVIFHLSSGWRLGLGLTLLAGTAALAALGCYFAFIRRNRIEHVARLLEARDPTLGSRLINLLQLSAQTTDPGLAPLTRQLAQQATETYAAELRETPFERLARTDQLRRQLRRAFWGFLIFVAIGAIGFRISAVELARFGDPFGDHPAYSFTHLEIVNPRSGGTNVLYDGGLVIHVNATGHHLREVFLTAFPQGHREAATTLPMFDESGGSYNQALEKIRSNMVVFAHTKDHSSESAQALIGVTLTPQLENVLVQITPPPYTGLRPQEKPYAFKGLEALEGSEVRFRLHSNRPLREGLLEFDTGDGLPEHISLTKTAENEVTGSLIARRSGRTRLSVVDVTGLPSQGDHESGLTVTYDLPPEVHLANPEHDAFVALDFKLQAQIQAGDDYGLREIRLHRGLNGVFSAPKVFAYTNIVRDSRETFDFDFAALGVEPGDVISLFAEAIDNTPQPHLAHSQTVRLAVISVDDYNNYLREQGDIADAEAKYSDLNEELQKMISQQKQLGDDIQKLEGQASNAAPTNRQALAPQLDRLTAAQNELNQKLKNQADRMENFVRQNPVYDVETNLQGLLAEQAGAIRASVRTNDETTRQVTQSSSPADGPRRVTPEMLAALKRASDEQVARLAGAQEDSQNQVVRTLDDMDQMQQLLKDFNLFESLYREQENLTSQTAAYNRASDLNREDQLALKDLASREKDISDLLGELQDKLRGDAKAALSLFPKAAQSGLALADEIGRRRLQTLANQATGQMLAGSGDQSYQLAGRLQSEMEQMFTQCQGGNCPSGNELDSYLALHRMSPNKTFAQMARSRKFGFGTGRGAVGAQGEGLAGSSGSATSDNSSLEVMGNEAKPRSDVRTARQSSRFGKGGATLAGTGQGETEKPDTLKGVNPVNRQSAAVASETVIQQYNDVVDSYFKAITTRKEKP